MDLQNPKAGCMKNAFYDALDAIYVSCIHNSNSTFYVLKILHPRPVMTCAIVCSLAIALSTILCMCTLHEQRWVEPRLNGDHDSALL